jgi:outer membrane protein assembly factor BamB
VLLTIEANTYASYNNVGGKCFFNHLSTDGQHAKLLSFQRPLQPDILGNFYIWDQFFTSWLDAEGYAADYCVNADHDAEPDLLDGYRANLRIGHGEYTSRRECEQLQRFVAQGGNLILFAGNAFWHEVEIRDHGRQVFCDKTRYADRPLDRGHTSFLNAIDNLRQRTIGVSYTSCVHQKTRVPGVYDAPTTEEFGFFRVVEPDHWVFEGTGLQAGDEFGRADSIVGVECDAADIEFVAGKPRYTGNDGVSPHFKILAIADAAGGALNRELGLTPADGADEPPFFATVAINESEHKGTVFNAATIEWGHGLYRDDSAVARITHNVLNRLAWQPEADVGVTSKHGGDGLAARADRRGTSGRTAQPRSAALARQTESGHGPTAEDAAVRFIFAADPHVHSEKTRDWLIEDLRAMQDADFIVLGGDLTWSGTPEELQLYNEAIATSSVPVYSVFGGHDGNALLSAGAPEPTLHYREHVGPLWYGFDAGPSRCLAYVPDLDYMTPREKDYLSPAMREQQAAWLEKEIAALPAEQPLLVFQHMPTTAPLPAALRAHRPKAIMTGHWHFLRAYEEDGCLHISVPALAVTGFGGAPRGYLQCCIKGDALTTEFRRLPRESQQRRSPLPAADGAVSIRPGDDWPDIHGGPAGRVRRQGPCVDLRIAWRRPLAGLTLLNSPVVNRGRVCIATPDEDGRGGWVACLAASDGAALWEHTLSAAVLHTPAAAGDQLLLLSADGRVTSLDLETGHRRWTVDIDAGNHRWAGHGLLAHGDRAYLRTPQHMACLSTATGEVLWQTPFRHSDWMCPCGVPLYAQGRIFVPALFGEGITCLDPATGEVLWNTARERALTRICGGLGHSPDHSLIFAAGFVFDRTGPPRFTQEGWPDSSQAMLVALHADDGEKVWECPVGPYNYSAPVFAEGTVLLSDTVTGRLLALDPLTGEKRWSFQSGPALQCTATDRRAVPSISGAAAVADGTVYIGASDGRLYAIDLASGRELARLDLGAAVASSPALSGNGLYVATCAGVLYGIAGDVPQAT